MQIPLGAGEADIGEAALLLQAGAAALVERALVREQAFLPAGQEHGLELQPLGRMQRHDGDGVELLVLLGVHDQRDMLEEGAQRLVFLHGADQLLQVFEPARRLGRAVVLPHLGVAALLQDDLGELGVRLGLDHALPAARNWRRPRAAPRAASASARRSRRACRRPPASARAARARCRGSGGWRIRRGRASAR